MKKYISFLLSVCMLASAIPLCAHAQSTDVAPSRYASDAFCYSFEEEDDFNDSRIPITSSSAAALYTPGAGGSKAALKIRQDTISMPPNGNISTGINALVLTPGVTYKVSVWLKILSHENYKVAPNVHFFFMNNSTQLYSDPAATTPVSGSGIFDQITANTSSFPFYEADGTVTGEWRKVEAYYTPDDTLGSYYIKPGDKLYCNTFMRIGSSAHSICTPDDYTDAFLDSITVPVTDPETGKVSYQIDKNGFYTEYAVDDWSLEPYMAPVASTPFEGVYNDFDSASWATASGITWRSSSAKCSIVPDHTINSNVLEVAYAGNPYSYMEVSPVLPKSKPLMFNRAYEISFRIKGSEALTHYFKGKQNYLKLIPERANTDRLERTKHKWSETRLKTLISEEWQDVSLLWYEPTPHMLGANSENNPQVRLDLRVYGMPITDDQVTETINGKDVTYVYSYQNENGETVYADFSDFAFRVDDFTVRPLDIVLNGDMAYASQADTPASTWDATAYLPGENPKLSNIFGSGTILPDATAPQKNALVLSKKDAAPGQKVEINQNENYTISFWAKADTPDSVGTHIFPVLDRSIHGAVRDNAVTAINPEGRTGYGNLTGEIGDIPYYLYRGSVEQHTYNTLEVKSGEALVYDDYFARMKSVDGYENQDMPSAWNYQYFNGKEWISQNNDAFSAVGDDFALTAEWKKYTVTYRWDYEGQHYRLPSLSFYTDAPADFRLADLQADKQVAVRKDPIRVKNLHCDYNTRSLYVGSTMQVHYDYVNEDGFSPEGASLVKFLIGDASGDFAVSSMAYCRENRDIYWEIPDIRLGNRIGFEILPIAEDGTFGIPQQFYTESFVKGNVTAEIWVDSQSKQAKFTVNADFADNALPENVTAYVSLYDSNNRMLQLLSYPVEEGTLSENVPLQNAQKAKIVVVEGNDYLIPCCMSVSDLCFKKNEAPFEYTDTLTVAFMGGSSASGAGIYDGIASTYSTYVGDYLQDTYPDKKVEILRYIEDGATTKDGCLQAQEVAAAKPDLVFIDYIADDKKASTKDDLRTLVETLTAGETVPYIIFLYSGDKNYNDYAFHYREIAAQYKIPHIHLSRALSEHLSGHDAQREGYMFDDIHPSIEGHIAHATTIIDAMSKGYCFSKIR